MLGAPLAHQGCWWVVLQCKHQLAAQLAEVLGRCEATPVDDDALADMMLAA